MNSFETLPDLDIRLDRLYPAEPAGGDWIDVITRAGVRRTVRAPRLAIAATLVSLVLVAVATATYLALRSTASSPSRPSTLSLFVAHDNAAAQIVEVLAGGRTRVVWHCPGKGFCGDPTSLAWSPDGRRVAFTLDELGARNVYVGLHIVDLRTGHDLHIPRPHVHDPLASQPGRVFPPFLEQMERRLGCQIPRDVTWSPNGRVLAYGCVNGVRGRTRSEIHTIRFDGTHSRWVRTGSPNAAAPAWSPDGTALAFAGFTDNRKPSIYTVRLDGTHPHMVAPGGSAPTWARTPDGDRIAYEAASGTFVVSPSGGTPVRVAPAGLPAWSADGRLLAVGTTGGTYVVDWRGRNLRRSTTIGDGGLFGGIRPAWRPLQGTTPCGGC